MKIKQRKLWCVLAVMAFASCQLSEENTISEADKKEIWAKVQSSLNKGAEATRTKNITAYMEQLPEDLVIYDESGEIISRATQKEYALRDWAIIDTTLRIKVEVDSIQFLKRDSIIVFNSQMWERMMFQKDGVTLDTVLTTQRHRETWKLTPKGWLGYDIKELGGKVYINGKLWEF